MSKLFASPRFLGIYSGILTIVFAVTMLTGFVSSKKVQFDEITVQRINVVEPDGTLRMTISDKARLPGIVIKGIEHSHPNGRGAAGMIFFNDEGTENGGLTFGGMKDKNGQVSSHGHLSFDEYEKDQVLTLDGGQDGDRQSSALTIVDNPNYSIGDFLAVTDRVKGLPADQQKAETANFFQSHGRPHQRLFLGKDEDRSVALKLQDLEGRDRIVIQVAADGFPVIRFLDQNGTVISELPAKR